VSLEIVHLPSNNTILEFIIVDDNILLDVSSMRLVNDTLIGLLAMQEDLGCAIDVAFGNGDAVLDLQVGNEKLKNW